MRLRMSQIRDFQTWNLSNQLWIKSKQIWCSLIKDQQPATLLLVNVYHYFVTYVNSVILSKAFFFCFVLTLYFKGTDFFYFIFFNFFYYLIWNILKRLTIKNELLSLDRIPQYLRPQYLLCVSCSWSMNRGCFFRVPGLPWLSRVSVWSVGNNLFHSLTALSPLFQRLSELLKSKKPGDLQEANRLIKNMVKEVGESTDWLIWYLLSTDNKSKMMQTHFHIPRWLMCHLELLPSQTRTNTSCVSTAAKAAAHYCTFRSI